MNLFELFAKISVDTSDYEKGVKGATEKSKDLQKSFEESARYSETLENKLKVLASQHESAKKEVDKLTDAFNKAAKEKGADSKEAQELAEKLKDAENKADGLQKEMDDLTQSTAKSGKEFDSAGSKLSNFADKLKTGLATAAKVGAAALGAASAGVAALTKASVDNYAEYEQLAGGSKLLFGDAYDFIAEKAQNAFSTVQMSQNDYLQQVNGFATGLKTALGGNEQAAAELADRIINAEADIVAATGNSQENVQNAFNGIMKSNFTMLDNLQIGITPTKEGFQEVIDKVNEWNAASGRTTNYVIDNLADCQNALVDYIEMQGLQGYAANEAADTIQGSLSMMKSAWQNLVTGIADPDQDLGQLITNVFDSAVIVGENLVPRIQEAMTGIGNAITQIAPIITEKLPELINSVLPSLLETGGQLLQTIVDGLMAALPALTDAAVQLIVMLGQFLIENLPTIVDAAVQIIIALANGLAEALPELIPSVVEAIITITETLIDNIDQLIDAAIAIILALADGLVENTPKLIEKLPEIITKLVDAIIENAPKLLKAAAQLMITLGKGLIKSIGSLLSAVGDLLDPVLDAFGDWWEDIKDVGKNIVKGLWEGITAMGSWIKDKVGGFFKGIIGKSEDTLDINSPSKVFAGIGENMALGVGVGWDKSFDKVAGDIQDGLDFSGDLAYNTYSNGSAFGGGATGYGQGTQVVQNIYSQAKTAADLMEEARWNFDMAVAF